MKNATRTDLFQNIIEDIRESWSQLFHDEIATIEGKSELTKETWQSRLRRLIGRG
jgi:hypothetical protein